MNRDEIEAIAFDAYQYAYPLVIMEITRRQATNVPDADSVPMRAPMNQFAHFRRYPDASAREVVRFNFDTLYSFAWLDLREQPVILTVPDAPDRYYLTPMLDMWTEVFAVPGTRTTGGVGMDFALTAPGWDGALPGGVEHLRSPTPIVWVMGRTQTGGPADYDAVHAVQDQYRITPLSAWGREYTPPRDQPVDPELDDDTDPLVLINRMSGTELLASLAELLTVHSPHPPDYPILHRMHRIGLRAGEPWDPSELDSDTRAAIDRAGAAALQDLIASTTDGSLGSWNGQWMTIQGGSYGTDYRRRAMVALGGLGCNLNEDALYPGTATDENGEPLSGAHRYVLRFEAGALPPAQAFWSLTMYDSEGFQIPNPIDRYAIGDRDPLRFGDDGSLELYVQHERPEAEREANWLPAPDGPFQPMLRIYSPEPEALRHGLTLPALRRRD